MDSTLEFPRIASSDVRTTWAPLIVEPILGGPERVVVAIAAISDNGEVGFQTRVDDRRRNALFGSAARKLGALIDASVESMSAHLNRAGELFGWRSPFPGVYLGEKSVDYVPTFEAIFDLAPQLCSALGAAPALSSPVRTPRVAWSRDVEKLIKELNPRLSNSVNAQLRLSTREHTVTFTFYGVHLAANVVLLNPQRLSDSLRDARAHLWNLNLLADAPGLLFRPGRLELVAGSRESSSATSDAIEELALEASRRNVDVFPVRTPEDAARHIVAHAA